MTLLAVFCLTVVDCESLGDPDNGQVTVPFTTFGATATYSCNEGFILSGSLTRTCDSTGAWSGTAPNCKGIALYYVSLFYLSSTQIKPKLGGADYLVIDHAVLVYACSSMNTECMHSSLDVKLKV